MLLLYSYKNLRIKPIIDSDLSSYEMIEKSKEHKYTHQYMRRICTAINATVIHRISITKYSSNNIKKWKL